MSSLHEKASVGDGLLAKSFDNKRAMQRAIRATQERTEMLEDDAAMQTKKIFNPRTDLESEKLRPTVDERRAKKVQRKQQSNRPATPEDDLGDDCFSEEEEEVQVSYERGGRSQRRPTEPKTVQKRRRATNRNSPDSDDMVFNQKR